MSSASDDAFDLNLEVPTSPMSSIVRRLVSGLVEQSGRQIADIGYVPIKARRDCSENECMPSITRLVTEAGGEMVTGWRIWEAPDVCACAEHHAVWRKPNGDVVDPNQYGDGPRRIFFVVDPSATWAGEGHLARRSFWVASARYPGAREAVDHRMLEEGRREALHYARLGRDIPYEYARSE